LTPPGDFSVLVKNGDATFTRTLPDGTKYNFTAGGDQASLVDRNGNTVSYAYNANHDPTSITDSYGLVTQLAYNAQGYVNSITDPAGRITQLGYDTSGTKLTSITDPDPDGAGPLAAPVTAMTYTSA